MQLKMTTRPEDVGTAQDYAAYAESRLSHEAWQYLQSGAGDDLTLQRNTQAFAEVALMPQSLADVRGGHTRLTLFGQTFEHPILLAPIAYQSLFHPDGECASAVAANAQGGQMVVSSLASQPLEDIVRAAEQPLWFQLYWQGDRTRTLALAQRAITAGYGLMMLTVDAPVKQATLQLPQGVEAVNLPPELPFPALSHSQSAVFDGWMGQAPTWDDVAWLRDQMRVPFLLKGLLSTADAARALALGCDGLVVSSHGGRVLDGVPASLDALPAIVETVAGRVPLLLDSGVRNGRDVFKAMALGVAAVMIGRPYIWGLSTAGALGVAHVLRLMRDELEMTMALTGCRTLADVDVNKVSSFAAVAF